MQRVSSQEVRSVVLRTLEERLAENGIDPSKIPDDFDLLTQGIIDSMGVLELIVEIEGHFGIKLDLDDLPPEQLTIIGPFSRYVEQKHGSNGPSLA
jgi:acyl carrier protein